MRTVLYANGLKNIQEKLQKMIYEQVSGTRVYTCNSIELLSQVLRLPLNHVSVVILLVASRDELVQFNCMSTLFDNIRVILVLPDKKKDTLSLGFKFKTSFVSYLDSNLQDVASVLGQILKKLKENKQNG